MGGKDAQIAADLRSVSSENNIALVCARETLADFTFVSEQHDEATRIRRHGPGNTGAHGDTSDSSFAQSRFAECFGGAQMRGVQSRPHRGEQASRYGEAARECKLGEAQLHGQA